MLTRNKALIALVVALVLGMSAMAFADGAPTLTAGKTSLVYPHSTYLVSTVTTNSVLMKRLAGASDWTTVTALAAGTTTMTIKPMGTTAFQVLSADETASDVVTVSVAAKLSKPQFKGKGRKGHKVTVKGTVQPLFAGTVDLTFFRWEKIGTVVKPVGKHGKTRTVGKYAWVQHGDSVSVTLKRQNSYMSKWSYKWTPSATGKWKVVVSEQDVAHSYASAYKTAMIKH